MAAPVLSKAEQLDRRVDVDDLVALSIALGVSPNRLLLTDKAEGQIELAPSLTVHASDAWEWARGKKPLGFQQVPLPGDLPQAEVQAQLRAEREQREAFIRENAPEQGDFYMDPGMFLGDRDYALTSLHGTLLNAMLSLGLTEDRLHMVVAAAARYAEMLRNGDTAEAPSPTTPQVTMPKPLPRPEPQPVIAAIITSGQSVLITQRRDANPPWGFVTGWSEPGETHADTIIREAKEEADLQVKVGERIGERDHPLTGKHMIYYAARPTRGTEIHVGDKAELLAVRWASLAEAEQLMPDMFGPVHAYLERTLTGS